MKSAIAFLAAATLGAMPAAAQQHQEQHQQAHPAGHPTTHAPAMHTVHPTTHTHVTTHHVTTHHVVHHHITTHVHHVYHHAVHHAVHAAGHRAPRAVVMKFRKNVVAAHRFHAGPYRAPRGWAYRRWVFGERLPGIYFAPGFWITDFLAFDLFAPPDGYVWVRYGPDAMMIDQYTGEIIQVQYGVFF